jgi:hypothetical protein
VVTISLHEATQMPSSIDVAAIAEDAIQAAFGSIATALGNAGYPVSGDFMPGEVFALEEAFALFVRSMALNNATISALNEEEVAAVREP